MKNINKRKHDFLGKETATCRWCGEETPFTEDAGKIEADFGWLCHRCIAAIKSREGNILKFVDDDIYTIVEENKQEDIKK